MNKKAKKPSYEELEKRVDELETYALECQQTENELRDTQQRYRDIIESIHEGYFELDLKGNYIFFNRHIHEFFGYTREEFKKLNYKGKIVIDGRKLKEAENAEIYEGVCW